MTIISNCPDCGAPIYGQKTIKKGDEPEIKYTCTCRVNKWIEDFQQIQPVPMVPVPYPVPYPVYPRPYRQWPYQPWEVPHYPTPYWTTTAGDVQRFSYDTVTTISAGDDVTVTY